LIIREHTKNACTRITSAPSLLCRQTPVRLVHDPPAESWHGLELRDALDKHSALVVLAVAAATGVSRHQAQLLDQVGGALRAESAERPDLGRVA
jgi:hypothetical protein